jgi:O-antigen ligase
MLSRARVFIAPAYVLACLILGGSAQGIWSNMLLRLVGVAIIAWAAFDNGDEPLAPSARHLLLLTVAAIAIVALQLIPLPAATWVHLGPRGAVAEGFRALGQPVPSEPLSLTPALGLDSLLAIIPPLAVVCAMVRLKAYRPQWLAVALIAGTLAGIALGALQVASSADTLSPWYLFEDTSNGRAVGFFANADHMATLLVMTIPFLAAVIAAARTASMQRYSAIVAVAAGLGLLVVVGLALNGSLAGYGLALPVIAASVLVVLPSGSRLRLWVVALAAILVVGALTALETTAIGSGQIGAHATSSVQSRSDLAATTSHAVADFMPFGSGLGSFRSVYALYENPADVTQTYVVHAHNDYLEVALELGIAGIVLMLLFLAWWAAAVWRAWRTAEAGPFARAAAIASAAVLIHSLVDFPLRTAAIAACFGMCLALLADSRAAPPKERKELRRKRHREFK